MEGRERSLMNSVNDRAKAASYGSSRVGKKREEKMASQCFLRTKKKREKKKKKGVVGKDTSSFLLVFLLCVITPGLQREGRKREEKESTICWHPIDRRGNGKKEKGRERKRYQSELLQKDRL